ncbi:MAG: Gfo/Idh/MocA family oxidoreductase, partial [Pyramidobacter sp.]|nr:Gfo/Idh/MocA family oxidoreductase [Pyramidobacter sp.]
MNRMEPIRVGVIGVGHLGRIHARIYKELMGVKLVGVVDSSQASADEIGRMYNVPSYTDIERFLQEQRPEAISVVVPTVYHFDVASKLAARGIHLLVEKPVTSAVEQASALLDIAREHNIVLQVGHVERFNSAIRYLSEQIVQPPLFIQSRRQGPFSSRIGDVGVVLDLMIHDIDIILSLVKSDVV